MDLIPVPPHNSSEQQENELNLKISAEGIMTQYPKPLESNALPSLNSQVERGETPQSAFRSELPSALQTLYSDAITKFGAQCLWNASPSQTRDGMRMIVERLRRYGGMAAWRLALEIEEKLGDDHAPG